MASDPDKVLWSDRKHWLWFPWTFTKYEVRNERLYVQRGLFSTTYDETLLYRIVDLRLSRTFGQKICGTGTIHIFTRVDTAGEIELRNIKNAVKVKDYLSKVVEEIRKDKNVVGKEFFGAGMSHGIDIDGDGIADEDCDFDSFSTLH